MATRKKATKPAEAVQEVKEEKEYSTFWNALGIQTLLNSFKEPTRADRKKLDAYEGFLNEVTQGLSEREQKVFDFYGIKGNTVEADNPKFNEIVEKLNTIRSEKSAYSIDQFQQFSEEELDRFTEGMGMPRGDRKEIYRWLGKPEN